MNTCTAHDVYYTCITTVVNGERQVPTGFCNSLQRLLLSRLFGVGNDHRLYTGSCLKKDVSFDENNSRS